MQAIYKVCIFCGKALPEPSCRGDGEHIVPEFIYGSLKTKDVCIECNNFFGSNVDHLILKDARIIDAINRLNIVDLKNKILERSKSYTKDVEDGREISMKIKDGKPKMIPFKNGNKLSVGQEDTLPTLLNIIRKECKNNEEFEQSKKEIERNLQSFWKSEVGTVLKLPHGGSIRKGQLKGITVNYNVIQHAGKKLAAKIIYEFMLLTFDLRQIEPLSEDLNSIGRFALGLEPDKDWLILYADNRKGLKHDYFHRIQFGTIDNLVTVDVDFFGYVNYRGILRPKERFIPYGSKNKQVEWIGVIMTFKPDEPKSRFMGYKYIDEDDWYKISLP